MDFYIGWGGNQYSIRNFECEGSDRFLVADFNGAAGGAATPIILDSIKWYSDSINADLNAIVFKLWGPLILHNIEFTGSDNVATFDAVDETGVFMWTGTEWITRFATCTF